MIEILQSSWTLLAGLLASTWDIVCLVAVWVWEVLCHLHVNTPRLEGLLVGVGSAWLMLRRDKHPLLRVLSAPLKLVVDILDLFWDQLMEVGGDLWSVAYEWVLDGLDWVKNKIVSAYNRLMGLLKNVKDKLSNLRK